MTTTTILGCLLVAFAGLLTGSGAWPFKLMRQFQFEHWFFIGMVLGFFILPWTITLLFCPGFFEAAATVPIKALIISNLFATGWGVANVLCGLCFVRIGVALTGAILTGLGVSVGVTLPMIFKGTGKFKDAPDLGSPASWWILGGVAVMMIGVVIAAVAGFGRERALQHQKKTSTGSPEDADPSPAGDTQTTPKQQKTSTDFLQGLIMTVIAGVLSCGMALAFVYSQGPIIDAMKANGAHHIPANFAVWALGLFGGAMVNVVYPAYLLTKNKSWGVLTQNWREFALAIIIGINLIIAVSMMGMGMIMVGALGASIGFGIQQAMQMLGGQGLGFISGEWHGVHGQPRYQMYTAIALLIVAAVLMALGNSQSAA